jgi:hypothetical protein
LLVAPEKKEVVAISLWETKEYAEAYNREQYPQIEKIVARFIEGIPVVKKFEAEYSTFHKTSFATTVRLRGFPSEEGAKLAPSFLGDPCGNQWFGILIGILLGPTLVANSLCRGQEQRTFLLGPQRICSLIT